MKLNRPLILTLILLIIVAAVYRVLPTREMGYAPHLAMALFAGAVIKDKKWAFAFPIFSMFISDLIYQLLFIKGVSMLPGFYEGQITNYILFACMTAIGFLMKKVSVVNIIAFSLIVCVSFFLLSNFFVWVNGSGLFRPRTFDGLMMCYTDALPFFRKSVESMFLFSAVLFGAWKLIITRYPSSRLVFR